MSSNMYLKFENPTIAGSSTAPQHEGEIEVLSWSHGFVQPTSPTRVEAGSGTAEQAVHQNLTFTKYVDSSMHELLKICWSGKQIGKATLRCFRSGAAPGDPAVEYLTVAMEHVVISNYSISGGPGEVPLENVSLDYGIVQYVYRDQKTNPAGDRARARHDLERRKVE
ncbi:type VI secretion system tube protein Hcp [Longimicrobium sp.]|uniref:Hcp family type VI secretion system effector n=1 Tax=Longimicrobium sp. TaxID=2029185 RepID=UPI002C261B34|nr:type VI secretion system tube protein Hcp [Longimicrobium sp.]HSU13807.1 type VI secretion system tube protein Hcp [Longimicrobium sp.]